MDDSIDVDSLMRYCRTLEDAIGIAAAEFREGGDVEYAARVIKCMQSRILMAEEAAEAAAAEAARHMLHLRLSKNSWVRQRMPLCFVAPSGENACDLWVET
jgi:hypothetical protein